MDRLRAPRASTESATTAATSGSLPATSSRPSTPRTVRCYAQSMSPHMRERPSTAATSFRSPRAASRKSTRRPAEYWPPFRRPARAATRGWHGPKGRSGSESIAPARSIRSILRPGRFCAPSSPIDSSRASRGRTASSGTRRGKATRVSCGKSTRRAVKSCNRSRCLRASACRASSLTAVTTFSAGAAAAASCGSSAVPSALDPDSLPGARTPAQQQGRAQENDIDDDGRPTASSAIAPLRQEVKPTLAGREDHDVRQRNEHEPADREDERDRHSDVPCAAQAHAAAKVQAVEKLVDRSEPEKVHAEIGCCGRAPVARAGKSRQQPGPRYREREPDAAHHQGCEQDDPAAETHRPVAVAGADRLADQRGARGSDPDPGHVGNGGQDRDHLRRRARDGAESHFHHLKHGEAENVGSGHHAHRQAEEYLLPDEALARPPRQVRLVGLAERHPQKKGKRDRESDRLRNVARPGGAGNTPAQPEDEKIVEDRVGDGRGNGDQEADPRATYAVEKADHRPCRHAEGSARDAGVPKLLREIRDTGSKSEGRQDCPARRTERKEERRDTNRQPECRPGGLRCTPVAPSAVRMCG